MVICFNEKINNFSENNLNNFSSYDKRYSYIQSLMPDLSDVYANKCPSCGAKYKLVKYGSYHRNISCIIDDTIENYFVSVHRIICTSCNHTHALLPNFIVPYKIMALSSIAIIVKRATASSAYTLANTINLSFQAIYAFIACIFSFFYDFKILNNSKQYYSSKNFNVTYFINNIVILSAFTFRWDFFEFHNWILFMQKFRNNSSPPVTISVSKTPST